MLSQSEIIIDDLHDFKLKYLQSHSLNRFKRLILFRNREITRKVVVAVIEEAKQNALEKVKTK